MQGAGLRIAGHSSISISANDLSLSSNSQSVRIGCGKSSHSFSNWL